MKDYIFYEVAKPNTDYEIWALDVSDDKSTLVSKQLFNVQKSTPPDGNWLLIDKNSVNFLELEECQIKPVYKFDPKYKTIDANWLNKDLLLINAFDDYPYSTDLYILNINTQKAELVSSGKFIQAISTNKPEWIQTDGNTIEAAQWQGSTKEILKEFTVSISISPGAIEFLPHTDDFIFIGSQKNNDDIMVWKTTIAQDTPQIVFNPGKDSSLAYHQLSPNGRYLGLVQEGPDGYFLIFLNLKNNSIDFKWPYPFTKSNPEFRWSPDSKFIAMPYEGAGSETPFTSSSGIQIMEIKSGKLKVVLERDVITWLIGWYSGK